MEGLEIRLEASDSALTHLTPYTRKHAETGPLNPSLLDLANGTDEQNPKAYLEVHGTYSQITTVLVTHLQAFLSAVLLFISTVTIIS